jgi:hypothetical protein
MINLILAGGFSIANLPMILLGVLIIVLFLALLWFILSKAPEPIASWSKTIVIVLGGIILLWFLISLYTGQSFG